MKVLYIYFQLGLGNTKTEFEPQIVVKDENENYLKPIKKVACNVTGTFIIVESTKLYTCGLKNIGHGDIEMFCYLEKSMKTEALWIYILQYRFSSLFLSS